MQTPEFEDVLDKLEDICAKLTNTESDTDYRLILVAKRQGHRKSVAVAFDCRNGHYDLIVNARGVPVTTKRYKTREPLLNEIYYEW